MHFKSEQTVFHTESARTKLMSKQRFENHQLDHLYRATGES